MSCARVPVLLYHAVSDRDKRDRFSVSPSLFAEHLDAIAGCGTTPMTISQFGEVLLGKRPLPTRPVVLTFDDGYPDTLDATCTANRVGITSTVFVTTNRIGQPGGIALSDLRELGACTHTELGAHTVTHPRLDELPRERATWEIMHSRTRLMQLSQAPVEAFAYPHGAHSREVKQLVAAAGFRCAVAVKNAVSHTGDDTFAIARWIATRNTSPEQIAALVSGSLGHRAPAGERLMTKAYRSVRRVRRAVREPIPQDSGIVHPDTAPMAVREFDLSAPRSLDLRGRHGERRCENAALLLRRGSAPVAWVLTTVPASGVLTADEIEATVRLPETVQRQGGPGRNALAAPRSPSLPTSASRADIHLGESALTAGDAPLPTVSVVVTTCADPEMTGRCLTTLFRCSEQPDEVIVVDNRPTGSTLREGLRQQGIASLAQIADEPTPGLSTARNAGLHVASGDIVAFLDDDVIVDPDWLRAIRQTFHQEPETTACVTGPILPVELETQAQITFERFASPSRGFTRARFSASQRCGGLPVFPYTAGRLASCANSAFRRDALLAIGGFDAALGRGTPAREGEDLDAYIRLIVGGFDIFYEPHALAWHRHPRANSAVRSKAFGYGIGLGALITKQLLASTSRDQLLRAVPGAASYWLDPGYRRNQPREPGFRRGLALRELAGTAAGPIAFAISQARSQRGHAQRRLHVGSRTDVDEQPCTEPES